MSTYTVTHAPNTGADDNAAQGSPSSLDRSAQRAERREPAGAACWWNQFGDTFTLSRNLHLKPILRLFNDLASQCLTLRYA